MVGIDEEGWDGYGNTMGCLGGCLLAGGGNVARGRG